MFESAIIRIIVYLIGFYMVLASVQQLISTGLLDYQSWVLNAVNDPSLATIIISFGIPIGAFIIASAKQNSRKFLLWSLGFAVSYEIGAAILNGIDTFGQGTPWLPALFLGLIAGTLWGYHKLQRHGLCMGEHPDNVGYKIEKDDSHE